MKILSSAFLFTICSISLPLMAADLIQLRAVPLFSMGNVEYIGGFRLPTKGFGTSNVTYSQGPMTLGKNKETIFIVGHAHQQAIAEFRIPELVNSMDITDFKYASNVQSFQRLMSKSATGNKQSQDRIAGMEYINGQLFVTTYEYYDAAADATHNLLVVNDADNLAQSKVAGYHKLSPRAHAAGWISAIPAAWQTVLGGPYIVGGASGEPIISRWSVGPAAFSFNPMKKNYGRASSAKIKATKLLDYSLKSPIGVKRQDVSAYLNNKSGDNNLWTHLSRATFGFIVPGTRTYMTLGYSGGMDSGVGYKIKQDNGRLCDGYCATKASDYDSYYWLFDLNDLMDVKRGKKTAHKVMPYDYGRFSSPHPKNGYNAIIGGTFDYSKNILYLCMKRGDRSAYGWAPTILAFKINTHSRPAKPSRPAINNRSKG